MSARRNYRRVPRKQSSAGLGRCEHHRLSNNCYANAFVQCMRAITNRISALLNTFLLPYLPSSPPLTHSLTSPPTEISQGKDIFTKTSPEKDTSQKEIPRALLPSERSLKRKTFQEEDISHKDISRGRHPKDRYLQRETSLERYLKIKTSQEQGIPKDRYPKRKTSQRKKSQEKDLPQGDLSRERPSSSTCEQTARAAQGGRPGAQTGSVFMM